MATKGKAKPKASTSETLVNFILDKSGSMDSVVDATISGFNEYVKTLKKDGNKYEFTLTLFDTMIEVPIKGEAISQVPDLDREKYKPSGGTALYDAVCTTIKGVKEKKGQKVINIIMTDGEENSSKEYTQVQMKALIAEREKKGNWTFVYLGANQDSYAAAAKFGIPMGNAVNFVSTSAGVNVAMRTLSANTSNFAMSAASATSAFFAGSDQSKLTASNLSGQVGGLTASTNTVDPAISNHFSNLGKKSWEARRKKIL